MSDDQARQNARRHLKEQSVDSAALVLLDRLRSGELDPKAIEVAAWFQDPAARKVLGTKPIFSLNEIAQYLSELPEGQRDLAARAVERISRSARHEAQPDTFILQILTRLQGQLNRREGITWLVEPFSYLTLFVSWLQVDNMPGIVADRPSAQLTKETNEALAQIILWN